MNLNQSAVCLICVLWLSVIFAQDSTYTPNYKFTSGREVVVIYVGSSYCGPCQRQDFKLALGVMRHRLSIEARSTGANFWSLGISVDDKTDKGCEFLSQAGQFDEISVGRLWYNTAVMRYILLDEYSMPGVPQIVVLEREVSKEGVTMKIESEKILLRLTGTNEIIDWVNKKRSLYKTLTHKGLIID